MRRTPALAALILLLAVLGHAGAAPKPLKIFILAGQSNMEGQGVADLDGKDYNDGKGTLSQLLHDPAKGPQFQHLTNTTGGWAIREDVWVRYQREHGPLLRGPLTVGFSVYGDSHHFGPELQLGHVVGDHFENQVLLIKTAWGGKSLYKDFRPPSSGGEMGPYYLKMLSEIRAALTNLQADFPEYGGRGYELAGFVWYHGWNDGVDPKRAVPEYETNLVNLIKDVRRELGVPSLPVVVGELTGPWVKAPAEWGKLRQAQAAVTMHREFEGNVLFVETHEFVRPPELSPNPTHGHHEFGNAETYFLVGDALGKGMLRLVGGTTASRHQTNRVEGWTVLVNERLLVEQRAATEKALELLRGQLQEIVRVVPAPALRKLREVTLWFSPEYPGVKPRAEYHPGVDWLREHGRDPAMVKSVEFTDVKNFEAESHRMPNFTLHELAHAYHDRVIPDGFDNQEIQEAFQRAKAGKSYDKVERWFGNGRTNTFERAYAMTSPQEYFAESSEAYFSRNDFFPFTRDQLKQHDPEMEQLLGRLWTGEKVLPPYRRMDFGPVLFWTYQVDSGHIAQKGIAIRLDTGPGGVSKGRAWMVYEHDTMRLAAATTGDFVDWKGIAFDGSHGTHTSLIGERHLVNPVGPGWASPDGEWEDPRLVGRDQKRYGPLPREWAHYEGLYLHDDRAVIAARVGGTRVLESPGWVESEAGPVFTRTLNVGAASKPLLLRVAPDQVNVALTGDGLLRKDGGFWIAELAGGAKTRLLISRAGEKSLATLVKAPAESLDLETLTQGGPPRWAQEITTTSVPGEADGPFIADTFPLPRDNPWRSWMRPGGFDFTPDGKGAVVATWNGDVWRVDGVMAAAPATLRWRRVASGLFQPLGVKFRGNELFILCRDQLVRLTDLNGDGEADFIESFNNDHQVTEHFHEFAMGLQVDDAGNFYYAKSGRHALDSVVPQHGTLLRVSADGARTDILATGFRAANGVCLNDDGTFFVTDQEGFWTPKNRINRVKVGGFYGNMFGYSSATNTADDAMEPPMVWITNAKDRSPAELVWVPKKAWGALGGSLLNLSYGTGRIFIVPHEQVGDQWQGAVCELPMPAFATGIMRGRFAADGSLYTCGLFGWAGNATAPGGFHRIRHTEKPAHVPIAIHAAKGKVSLTFSDAIDPASVVPDAFAFRVWSLKRSANYGSNHYDEHPLEISSANLGPDARTVTIEIPELVPTQCYELKLRLAGKSGEVIERSLHGTIHLLGRSSGK
jgi:hypothetical protein